MKRLMAVVVLAPVAMVLVAGCDAPQPVAQGSGQAGNSPPAPPPPPGWEAPAPPPAAEPAPAPAASSAPAQGASGSRPAALPLETRAGVFAGGLDDLAAGPRSSSPPPATTPTPAPDTELVKAKKGVGIKGRSLDEHEGVVVTPVKTLFAFKERSVFEIQLPSALSLYDAANGGPPRSHEEFMEGVIKANGIKLPELPPGEEYWYDAEAKELMVKRPRMP